MMLTKDKEGCLCLVGEQDHNLRESHTAIRRYSLPRHIIRKSHKVGDRIDDLIGFHRVKLIQAREEVENRRNIINVLEAVKKDGEMREKGGELDGG